MCSSARVRVIADEHVAWIQRFHRIPPQHFLHYSHEGAEVDWDMLRLSQRPAICVEEDR